MCCIFQCFGWALDVLQRSLTLILSCLIGLAVCCGLTVAIVTGVAYGYNYSLSEFMEIARPEVTVYVRRGQFYDEAELNPELGRRSGGDEDNIFANKDYEDKDDGGQAKPLKDKWQKAQDIKHYGDKLGKYKDTADLNTQPLVIHTFAPKPVSITEGTTEQPLRRLASIPAALLTTVWKDGTSSIIMRKFNPTTIKNDMFNTQMKVLGPKTSSRATSTDSEDEVTVDSDSFYDVPGSKRRKESFVTRTKGLSKKMGKVDIFSDYHKEGSSEKEEQIKDTTNISPRRYWGMPTHTESYDDQTDLILKVDEDNVLYKAEENY